MKSQPNTILSPDSDEILVLIEQQLAAMLAGEIEYVDMKQIEEKVRHLMAKVQLSLSKGYWQSEAEKEQLQVALAAIYEAVEGFKLQAEDVYKMIMTRRQALSEHEKGAGAYHKTTQNNK